MSWPSGTKFAHKKLDSTMSRAKKTRVSISHVFESVPGRDRRTDRITIANTLCALRAVARKNGRLRTVRRNMVKRSFEKADLSLRGLINLSDELFAHLTWNFKCRLNCAIVIMRHHRKQQRCRWLWHRRCYCSVVCPSVCHPGTS